MAKLRKSGLKFRIWYFGGKPSNRAKLINKVMSRIIEQVKRYSDTKEHNLLGSNSFYSRKNQGGSRDQINRYHSVKSNTIKTLKLSNKYDSF